MSVHDKDKYAAVKELLGIPADEPIFILRAQDQIAEDSISHYAMNYRKEAQKRNDDRKLTPEQRKFQRDIHAVADNFLDWQDAHEDRVKFPD